MLRPPADSHENSAFRLTDDVADEGESDTRACMIGVGQYNPEKAAYMIKKGCQNTAVQDSRTILAIWTGVKAGLDTVLPNWREH